jgi:hypothetical protein
MNHPIRLKAIVPPLLMTLTLFCFGLSPTAKALLPPPAPDGGYPGGNTAEGINALHDVNTAVGINNTAVGANALTQNTTGFYNVAVGSGALASNTTGNFNMAIGTEALTNNNANFNLAIGFRVLFMNTTGNHLTGIGAAALRNNTTAGFNTAIGADAMRENTTGENNTAIGADALAQNTIAEENTAIGADALRNNTIGEQNTAIGADALVNNTTGHDNTVTGAGALLNNVTGHSNTANGAFALVNNTSGDGNIALGNNAGLLRTTGNFNIDIGNPGLAGESRTIRIGNNLQTRTFITGIRGVATGNANAIPVLIDSLGQLGTVSSSRRFKKDIELMEKTSEAILALEPVTFQYKNDKTNTPQYGLIAEQVADINPDLVVRDDNGEIYTVRYDAINAMLLNEFLKEHRKVEKLEVTVAQQRKDFEAAITQLQKGFESNIAHQQEQIEALTAGLQKVSAQLETSKFATGRIRRGGPAPQVVNNP